jgi:hypothetical protein
MALGAGQPPQGYRHLALDEISVKEPGATRRGSPEQVVDVSAERLLAHHVARDTCLAPPSRAAHARVPSAIEDDLTE